MAHKASLLGKHDEMLVLVADVEVDVGVGSKPALGDKRAGILNGGAHAVSQQHLLALGGGGRLVDGTSPASTSLAQAERDGMPSPAARNASRRAPSASGPTSRLKIIVRATSCPPRRPPPSRAGRPEAPREDEREDDAAGHENVGDVEDREVNEGRGKEVGYLAGDERGR